MDSCILGDGWLTNPPGDAKSAPEILKRMLDGDTVFGQFVAAILPRKLGARLC
jgi:hypothetical protein